MGVWDDHLRGYCCVYQADERDLIILSQILSGAIPFHDIIDAHLPLALYRSKKRPPTEPLASPDGESYHGAWSIAKACWEKRPSKRPHIAEVLRYLLLRSVVIYGAPEVKVEEETRPEENHNVSSSDDEHSYDSNGSEQDQSTTDQEARNNSSTTSPVPELPSLDHLSLTPLPPPSQPPLDKTGGNSARKKIGIYDMLTMERFRDLDADQIPRGLKKEGTDWIAVYNPHVPRFLDVKLQFSLLHDRCDAHLV